VPIPPAVVFMLSGLIGISGFGFKKSHIVKNQL
jgi:hypothetical protein